MRAAAPHSKGAGTTAHVERARTAADVHTAATHVHAPAATNMHAATAAHVHATAATNVHTAAAAAMASALCERGAVGPT
jgi:hypothetical protein